MATDTLTSLKAAPGARHSPRRTLAVLGLMTAFVALATSAGAVWAPNILAAWHVQALTVAAAAGGLALVLAVMALRPAGAQPQLVQRDQADAESSAARLIEADAALRSSEARFQAMMDYAPAEVIVKDLDGRYTFVNRAFERRIGKRADSAGPRRICSKPVMRRCSRPSIAK